MTSDPREFTVLARNLYALLAHGTLVWYCDHCEYVSEGSLISAGMHMRAQHPLQLHQADEIFLRDHL